MRRAPGPVIVASVFLAGAMIVVPLLGIVSQSWPPQFDSIQWRFGVGGLLSGTLSNCAVGLLILLWLGVGTERRGLVRVAAVLSGAITLATGAVLGLFVLDFMQLRQLVDPAARSVFDRSGLLGVGSLVLMFCVFAAFLIAGVATLRRQSGERSGSSRDRAGAGIVAAGRRDA